MTTTQVIPRTLCVFLLVLTHIPVNAQSVESLMNNGQRLLQRGAYSQAVTAFKKVLAREPDFFEARFNLGFSYLQWGNNAKAVAQFKKALKLQPKHSEVWANLAIAYENLNRSNEAISAMANAVNCDPGNVTARMNLAAMYANSKRMKQAAAQYRQLVAQDSTNIEALQNLATCLIAGKAIAEAKEVLQKVIAAEPRNGQAHADLGDIYLKREHDTSKAVVEYMKAISAVPDNPMFYQRLALVLERRGQKQDAIDVWKKALKFIDDVLNKEKIKDRIDRLEKSMVTTPGFGGMPGGSTFSKEKTMDLERELRSQETRKETKLIDVPPVDVSSDLAEVADDSSAWDLTKEAKRRAESRKSALEK